MCSGQAAALAGGTTMHIDFALPVNHDLMAGFREWQAKAQLACADYGFHMAVTKWDKQVADDMGKLVQQGINSFKFFMAYKVRQQSLVVMLHGGCRDAYGLTVHHLVLQRWWVDLLNKSSISGVSLMVWW
jgi:dihydroorotase-like cyclic amidohydrolase